MAWQALAVERCTVGLRGAVDAPRPPPRLTLPLPQEGESAGESLEFESTPKMLALCQLVTYCLEQREQLIVFAERWGGAEGER